MTNTLAPLISIIMPAYNAGKYIGESIESVICQTYSNWELVIIDDGSVDDTREKVNSYVSADERIKYIYQENAKQSRARNNGIKNSSGQYIAFLDADDLWLPAKLSTQIDEIISKGVDLVFAEAYVFEGVYNPLDKYDLIGSGKGLFAGEDGLSKFLDRNRIPMLTVVVKRNAVERVNNFTEDSRFPNAEDYHLWLKLLLDDNTFFGSSAIVGAYREHNQSVSSNDRDCLPFVVEAKASLLKMNNRHKSSILLYQSLKKSILKNFDALYRKDSADLYSTIKSSLQLIDKPYFWPLFNLLKKINQKQLAAKVFFFTLNYIP